MKKPTAKKLILRPETIRVIDQPTLGTVAGGSYSCTVIVRGITITK